jgi:hypothetical protein
MAELPATRGSRGPAEGAYDVELPPGSSAPVAVKITDMLGEEVLVVVGR